MLQIAPHREAVEGMEYKVVILVPENAYCSIIPKAEQFPKFSIRIKVAIVIIYPTRQGPIAAFTSIKETSLRRAVKGNHGEVRANIDFAWK
ncbi:hypothetical protein E3E31_00490 [Thermococcus sp. M39]|uniref:hypothetical protein n=1 Tax=unclassified Thermococcus TaxID=2627626 RepID=UPI00143A5693|nr:MULTISPECIES: hypothetical protein [unclassified Thermococcus]NJE07032.1 hypothetical protein [Thermococcus sp. M39]NJE13570.1 hypothetical protein [Thermococcus sp. LS2]